MDRAVGDYIGMLATVMNGLALAEALIRNGVDARVMSSLEMPKVAELFVLKKALSYLKEKKILICVAGT
jgi:uridylate kinase